MAKDGKGNGSIAASHDAVRDAAIEFLKKRGSDDAVDALLRMEERKRRIVQPLVVFNLVIIIVLSWVLRESSPYIAESLIPVEDELIRLNLYDDTPNLISAGYWITDTGEKITSGKIDEKTALDQGFEWIDPVWEDQDSVEYVVPGGKYTTFAVYRINRGGCYADFTRTEEYSTVSSGTYQTTVRHSGSVPIEKSIEPFTVGRVYTMPEDLVPGTKFRISIQALWHCKWFPFKPIVYKYEDIVVPVKET